MEAKVCSRCGDSKPLSEFSRNARKPDGHQAWCKQCKNEHHQSYYENNRSKWDVRRRSLLEEKRAIIADRKSVPCMDCGGRFPVVCMDFDHRDPPAKEFAVATATTRSISVKRLLDEIEKCDVVCSNCHRIRTHHVAMV